MTSERDKRMTSVTACFKTVFAQYLFILSINEFAGQGINFKSMGHSQRCVCRQWNMFMKEKIMVIF